MFDMIYTEERVGNSLLRCIMVCLCEEILQLTWSATMQTPTMISYFSSLFPNLAIQHKIWLEFLASLKIEISEIVCDENQHHKLVKTNLIY